VLPHRVANLAARDVGDLLGQATRPKPRIEDPLDGPGVEGAVLGGVLDRRDYVVDRPRDLELEDVVELGARRSLAQAPLGREVLRRRAPRREALLEQRDVVAAAARVIIRVRPAGAVGDPLERGDRVDAPSRRLMLRSPQVKPRACRSPNKGGFPLRYTTHV
jgi:hypothetical protein